MGEHRGSGGPRVPLREPSGIFRWGDDEAVVGAAAKALHGAASDVPSAFIFGPSKNFDARYGGAVRTAGGQELLSITRSYVKNFIRTGNPNGENLVTWAPWGETGNALVLDADRTKAWADTEASRVDLAATFRQMDDDQTVTPDAKAKHLGCALWLRLESAARSEIRRPE